MQDRLYCGLPVSPPGYLSMARFSGDPQPISIMIQLKLFSDFAIIQWNWIELIKTAPPQDKDSQFDFLILSSKNCIFQFSLIFLSGRLTKNEARVLFLIGIWFSEFLRINLEIPVSCPDNRYAGELQFAISFILFGFRWEENQKKLKDDITNTGISTTLNLIFLENGSILYKSIYAIKAVFLFVAKAITLTSGPNSILNNPGFSYRL